MSAFYLVIYIYAGVLAQGDSVSLVSMPMASMEACQRAGKASEALTSGSTKNVRFVCLKGQ